MLTKTLENELFDRYNENQYAFFKKEIINVYAYADDSKTRLEALKFLLEIEKDQINPKITQEIS